MEKTIIIYASIDGQTKKICHFIKEVLELKGTHVELFSIKELNKKIEDFDKIIIASSIRYGKHHEVIERFIEENYLVLNQKKSVFISVNLVARKAEKSTAQTNPYVIKFLNKIYWKPTKVEVFAGQLNYKMYGLYDRMMIKLIMLITKGPTSSPTPIEYTDWNKVKAFAENFSEM